MEEEIGLRVTRSRRRLSAEKSNDASSPVGTPTKKKITKVALKPHLDNIGENEVVSSPKRLTRRSIAPEPDEAVLTPSKRTTRVRSNTSLSSLVESPRTLRVTRRNSLLVESEPAKVTPPKPKATRRISQDLDSISRDENVENEPEQITPPSKSKATRRVSQDLNSISKDENGNTSKRSTRRSEHNILPQTPTTDMNLINGSVSDINDCTVAIQTVSQDLLEKATFKITSQEAKDVKSVDGGLTNERDMDTDIDKKTVSEEPVTTPTQLRKSPRFQSRSGSKTPEELASQLISTTNEEARIPTYELNNTIDSSDTDNTVKRVSEEVFLSQNNSKTRRSCGKNMSLEQNKSAFIEDNSNIAASHDSSMISAKELTSISPSNKENESLISRDNSNVNGKSTLDESDLVSSNNSIIRRTRLSKMSLSPTVLALGGSRKSFQKNNCSNISSESLNLHTSLEQNIEKVITSTHKVDIHITDKNADHQNSMNELACETLLNRENSIGNKDIEQPMDVDVDDVGDGKVSPNDDEIKSTSAANSSNDIVLLSHQQSTEIFCTIIMDDEKPNEDGSYSTKNNKKACNSVEELLEISKSYFEKSIEPICNKESTVDDANISNIIAGNQAEEEKVLASERELNNSISAYATEKNKEKTTDACCDVKNDTSEKLQNLRSRDSGKKQTPSKSPSNDLLDNSEVKCKSGKSPNDVSQLTPKRITKSPKLGLASSTPKVDIGDIKISKNVTSMLKNIKNVQTQSSDDDTDGDENDLLDNEAMDAGVDYKSGDSLATDDRDEIEQNEIREKGETLDSDEFLDSGDSEYEKDSFIASSDEYEALLSGTGDDLDLSNDELNQSSKSKEKYNKRMSKEQKQASREMYEARHGITNNKKSQRKSSSRKIETDSSESSDSEIIVKKSTHKMRVDSASDISKSETEKEISYAQLNNETIINDRSAKDPLSCDISKSETEKETSYAQLNNETIINDSYAKDPLSCTLPLKKRSLSNSCSKNTENVENSSSVLRHDESKEEEIEQVEVDENKSVYLNGDKTIDPLSNTACDDDDDDMSSLSSVDASVVDNYNSMLSVLNQSNKSCVKESSSDESDNDKSPKRSLNKKTELIASSGENENKIDETSIDIPIVNKSTVHSDSRNASNLSLHTCDSDKLKIKKDSAHANSQDLIEDTVKEGIKRKSVGMSILENDLSSPDVDVHNLNYISTTSNVKQDLCSEDKKLNTTEGDNIEIKNSNKSKKKFINSSDIEEQNIINCTNNVEKASEIHFSNEVLNKSKDEMKTESSLEGGIEKLSKKTKNKHKNQSLNVNDSIVENESIIENLNLSVSKKKEKKRNSIVSLTENGTTLDLANLCELTKTSQISSDCVTEKKKKKNDTTNLGVAETESTAKEDTKNSVRKKKKRDKLSNQSLNIVENSNDESLLANASVIDNLNLTIIKKKEKIYLTKRNSQDDKILDKSVEVNTSFENIDSKVDDKQPTVTDNSGDGNGNTTLKKAKRKNKNKSLNNDDSADVSNASVLNKSKDEMKTESSLEGCIEKLSKKTKNKHKNQSLNFNDSVVENESIIENLNLSVSKKKEKKRNSIVSLTENGTTLDSANLCELTKTSQISSDCVTEKKKKKNDTTNLGVAETESTAKEDTKNSVRKKKKRDKLSNQSLNIVENSNDESLLANASVIDNLNLTIIKKKEKINLTKRKSQDDKILDKSIEINTSFENIDSKADDKQPTVTDNSGDGNGNTTLKNSKRKNKNKSLNNDDSADVSNASVVDNLNLTFLKTKMHIKRNSEHKNDSFYEETNKGKDRSVLVSAQTIKMCDDSSSDDLNMRLLFSSDEETDSFSAKVEDILSCTALRADEFSEEDEAFVPLKKAEAMTNLLANEEGSPDDSTQIPGSTNCEKVKEKSKRNKKKKKKNGHTEIEVANVPKIEKELHLIYNRDEPSISNDDKPEGKLSKRRRRKRKRVADSETAEPDAGALKPQTQEASLKTKFHKEQVVHEPEPKAKKRKLKEEPMEHKKTKLSATVDEKSSEIRRLPQTFLEQLDQASKIPSNAPQETKLISTSEFKVDRANKRKAKPSEYLEQSILVGTEPTWTSNTGVMRTVKKPKLLPSIPTVSTSGEGFTTQFKIVPLVSGTRRKDSRTISEYATRNFKTDTLYGKKTKRITSEEFVRKRSNLHLW